ncbi:competence protein ComK [Peribacillus glennii]|uniref:Competence protein n=1 Tax=Peribacillus glennii TaxID=2303991 RepID=A0A372LFY9_9BACI|nr:competence protein ComK [Peribacillus glennii]RFU65200.1 hypothetical protein D0466_04660 [Peribacillus glennii]
MRKRNHYLINQKTVLIASEFDNFGKELSRIIEGKKTFLVNRRPIQIIDETLKYYGSSLAGATQGSKAILGDKYNLPIAVNPRVFNILIPCKTSGKKGNLWLAYSHIIHPEKINTRSTRLHLNFGHSIILNMKRRNVESRQQLGALLHIRMIERTTRGATILYEPNSGFIVIEKSGEYNLDVRKDKAKMEDD